MPVVSLVTFSNALAGMEILFNDVLILGVYISKKELVVTVVLLTVVALEGVVMSLTVVEIELSFSADPMVMIGLKITPLVLYMTEEFYMQNKQERYKMYTRFKETAYPLSLDNDVFTNFLKSSEILLIH